MPRLLLRLLVAATFLSVIGCSGVSENDMRKYAQRRSAPDSAPPSDAPAAAAKKSKAPAERVAKSAPSVEPKVSSAQPSATPAAIEAPQGRQEGNEKPTEPLTEAGRRGRSIANLERIGKALTAYVAKHGQFPTVAIPRDGELLLSWRVIILPELGYPELYARFRHNEPWNSKHNKQLLEYIPPEYQSPERFDAKTNYLGVMGRGMVFFGDSLEGVSSGLRTAELTDGADNTLAVVEVDDKFAQEWTRPADHCPLLDTPGDALGGLRGEGAFGILASGRVVLLPKDLAPAKLAALFTAKGGEPIGAAKSFLSPPTAEPPPPILATVADDPNAASQPLGASADAAPSEGTPTAAASSDPAAAQAKQTVLGESFVPDPGKLPVPDEAALARSRELLKQLYAKDHAEARTREQQRQFLQKLLAEAPSVEQNPADLHELARIARDMAVAIGELPAALSACTLLEERFQIDPLPQRLKVLQDLSKQRTAQASATAGFDEAQRLVRLAQEADRYEVAIPAYEALLAFARSANKDRGELSRLQQRLDELQDAKSLLAAAKRGLAATAAHPTDAAGSEAVGRYLCFVKNRWEAGLPYLARSDDIRLRGIASLELSADRTAGSLLSLADQYWDLAARFKQPQRRGLHLRAIWCYELVVSGLTGSLEKLKAQRRIEEAVALYGQEEIARVLAPLRANRASRD